MSKHGREYRGLHGEAQNGQPRGQETVLGNQAVYDLRRHSDLNNVFLSRPRVGIHL